MIVKTESSVWGDWSAYSLVGVLRWPCTSDRTLKVHYWRNSLKHTPHLLRLIHTAHSLCSWLDHTSSHFLPSGRFLLLSLSTSFCASTFLCPSLTGPTILLLTNYLSPCAAHIQTLNVVVATSLLTNSPPPPPQLLLFITRYVFFFFFRWKEWVSTVQPLI